MICFPKINESIEEEEGQSIIKIENPIVCNLSLYSTWYITSYKPLEILATLRTLPNYQLPKRAEPTPSLKSQPSSWVRRPDLERQLLGEKMEAKEWAIPTTIPTFTWPLLGNGRPECLLENLPPFPIPFLAFVTSSFAVFTPETFFRVYIAGEWSWRWVMCHWAKLPLYVGGTWDGCGWNAFVSRITSWGTSTCSWGH